MSQKIASTGWYNSVGFRLQCTAWIHLMREAVDYCLVHAWCKSNVCTQKGRSWDEDSPNGGRSALLKPSRFSWCAAAGCGA